MRRTRIPWSGFVGGVGLLAVFLSLPRRSEAFVFTFTGTAGSEALVIHPKGYTGAGQNLNITVGILSGTAHATEMGTSVQNAIATWNGLVPTANNVQFQNGTLPINNYDFESVLLHEMGHALGLGHPNLGDQAAADPNDPRTRFTNSNPGQNGYTFNAGSDNVPGSRDDVRGQDVNLNYFRKSNNDPFTIASVVDSTTYSRNLTDLPTGHNYSAAATREVAASQGLGTNTNEAVMTQGIFNGEARRSLSQDDVAGIRYAMSGLDERADLTNDNYTFTLTYAGITNSADILIQFTNNAGFAFTQSGATQTDVNNANHFTVSSADIFFQENQTGLTWFFNPVSSVPEPGTLALMGVAAAGGVGAYLRRRRAA